MATLPPSSDFTGASVTEGGFKSAITTLRSYLNDLFGSDSSNKALARETLQVPISGTTAKTGTYTAVAAGETWTFVAYYVEGASDAARTLIGIDAPASSQVTNGGNITGPALTVNVTGS
jgi:hypothetical protein